MYKREDIRQGCQNDFKSIKFLRAGGIRLKVLVVQRLNSSIQEVNDYRMDKYNSNLLTFLVESDFFNGLSDIQKRNHYPLDKY